MGRIARLIKITGGYKMKQYYTPTGICTGAFDVIAWRQAQETKRTSAPEQKAQDPHESGYRYIAERRELLRGGRELFADAVEKFRNEL